MNRDLPNLKRLWYCDHVHTKTGGCVCKKHGKPICASIENVSIPDIDQIRLKERLSRLPRARSVWDKMRHAAEATEGVTALQFFAHELMFQEPRPTEGAPKVAKSWHKFIEPNNRKKPR